MSLKSRRLRVPSGQVVPFVHTTPSCTASLGVASAVNQLLPPSYVVAPYACQTPEKGTEPLSVPVPAPADGVPRKKNDARSLSPATTSGKTVFCSLNGAPTSWSLCQETP